jgi:hypothetical protein
MPRFFDPDQLPPEQAARYDAALIEYRRVQQENIDLAIAHCTDDAQRDAMRALHAYHQPGPKSALFARLLSGQSPLPSPPPTSFGYPWYAVIEESGPFEVSRGPLLPAGAGRPARILINQCSWEMIAANTAAQVFDAWCAVPGQNGDAAELLAAQPEWQIACEPWLVFRLYLGRSLRRGRRDFVQGRAPCRDEWYAGGNTEIVRVLRPYREEFAATQARNEAALSGRYDGPYPGLIQALAEQSKDDVLPEDPSALDWVEFACDAWQIERLE